jgi:hypothetical protein
MAMTVEEALETVQSVLDQGHLSKVQDLVFRHSWEEQSYSEIAKSSGYELGYIRYIGSQLWQSLSKAFGTKVTKNNIHAVLKQYVAKHAASHKGSVFVQEWQQAQARVPKVLTAEGSRALQRQDWGETVDVSVFYGRTAELATLKQWIVQNRCRLVVLLGMGGIGKTALAVRSIQQVQDNFEYVIWRSLRNAPPVKELLTNLIRFLSRQQQVNLPETELIPFLFHQQQVNLPETVDSLISYLMEYLRSSRCLLVLDNGESILRSGERAGRYRSGYEGYGQLLRRVADEQHQSCLLLTSREKPIGLTAKEGETLPVRSLQLTGLAQAEAQEIFKAKGFVSAEDESRKLIEFYHGNPLALKIAATTIQSLFDGDIYIFLAQGRVVFGDIWDLLDQHFNRLSALEKQVMYYLAIYREWVTLPQLLEDIGPIVSYRELLEALGSLQQRSLIENQSGSFSLQPLIIEYMSERGTVKLTDPSS